MNESFAPMSALIILGLLTFWGAMQSILSRMKRTNGSKRKSRTNRLTVISVKSVSPAPPKKSVQGVQEHRGISQISTRLELVEIPRPQRQSELSFEAPLSALDIQDEPSPQATEPHNFCGQDLRGVRSRGKNLAGADLSHCNLVRAILADTDLHGANLAYADLTEADLVGADLSGCNCTGARFHGANLHGASLYGSNLTDTFFGPTTRPWAKVYSLRGDSRYPWHTVKIIGANLRGVDLTDAICTGSDVMHGKHDEPLYWTQW